MGEVWVIDTSAVAEVRRVVPFAQRKDVFARMTDRIGDGRLKYPRQVLTEFERPKYKTAQDHGWEWLQANVQHCSAHEPLHAYVAEAFREPQVCGEPPDARWDDGVTT